MKNLLRNHVLLLFGVLILCVFTSASAFAADQPATNASVRVIHAAPGAGNVDIFVDNNKVLTNFAYGTLTNYAPVPAGTHTIKVAPTGKGIGAAVIIQSANVTAGDAYTVAAVGTKDTGFSLQAFIDNNSLKGVTSPASASKIRVYHLSPNAGPVNISAGGKQVITNLSYKSASNYLPVAAGPQTFSVTALQPNVTVPVHATINAGTVVSVFAIGLYKQTPALQFITRAVEGKH
ncbi:DUF4397 domain-containing protein [Dictyobacter aurantiacus]|uniref:DUF4397 domain-containing protein n=1 Tax=Dictyobacter aurantiacus TaxID=1936993 RepID=A0A401Z9M6_9CHLR|nr:DUF4397 domain-containing protein [Dictyobacter aurantiacus]GCE03574.1 hypothetical protein KDAU_09030 [Dictyobacter aurantiacus]